MLAAPLTEKKHPIQPSCKSCVGCVVDAWDEKSENLWESLGQSVDKNMSNILKSDRRAVLIHFQLLIMLTYN